MCVSVCVCSFYVRCAAHWLPEFRAKCFIFTNMFLSYIKYMYRSVYNKMYAYIYVFTAKVNPRAYPSIYILFNITLNFLYLYLFIQCVYCSGQFMLNYVNCMVNFLYFFFVYFVPGIFLMYCCTRLRKMFVVKTVLLSILYAPHICVF